MVLQEWRCDSVSAKVGRDVRVVRFFSRLLHSLSWIFLFEAVQWF
jgi:hypothetical protein